MTSRFEEKVQQLFEGKVVRKDLTKYVKGNAVVPTYVLEYLLGQHCASSDEEVIEAGIKKVKNIINEHYVHRDESELVKSKIREKGEHKVIDRITAIFNDKRDVYQVSFANLGLKSVEIRPDIIKKHEKLLTGGVWCIVDLQYLYSEDTRTSPWIIENVKPIQLSSFNFDEYVELRNEFSRDEWIDLLLHSIGLNPDEFGDRQKLLQLVRLIPYCERNYNLIELGPKGTGKSHIYSEFSPHGILLSGGDVSVPKLFVNNSTGRIGLVGYWDVVAFDEFAGRNKRPNQSLVDIMKNYMANKTFSRGKDVIGAEASMAFVGNTDRSVAYMLRHTDLFEALPDRWHDSAFLDRIHFYLPGWEIDKLRNEMFSTKYGFIVDYLAEALKYLRKEDYFNVATQDIEFSDDMTSRDRDGTTKTFSGLVKLLYPDGQVPEDEIEGLLEFSMEGRRRVKDQLYRFDETFELVHFTFSKGDGQTIEVDTLENQEYAQAILEYEEEKFGEAVSEQSDSESMVTPDEVKPDGTKSTVDIEPGTNKVIKENQRGISYEFLFAPYLQDATEITVIDPYIRLYYQIKNFMEFCDVVLKLKKPGDLITLKLITDEDEDTDIAREQHDAFEELQQELIYHDIKFEFEFDEASHDRSIVTDTGWKIVLGRGLDIFQPYDTKNKFSIAALNQGARKCKPFEVTYLKQGTNNSK